MPRQQKSKKNVKRSNAMRKLKLKSKPKTRKQTKRAIHKKPKLSIKKRVLRKNRRNTKRGRRGQRGGNVMRFSAYPHVNDMHAPNGEVVDTSAMTPEQIAEANAQNPAPQKGGFVRGILPQPVVDLGDMARNTFVRGYNTYMGETSMPNLYSSTTNQPALSAKPEYNIEPNNVAAKIANAEYGAASYSPSNTE
jgi:hypothetical protein